MSNRYNNGIILTWEEKRSDIWISSYKPKAGQSFYFKIALSGTTSIPWYTIMIYKGNNLICREDKRSLEEAKDTCESFLKHMYYRDGGG